MSEVFVGKGRGFGLGAEEKQKKDGFGAFLTLSLT